MGSGALAHIERPDLIRMIVGRELAEEYVKTNAPTAQVGLEVAALTCPNKIEDISFSVRKGEIFGIYGLMGSGRTEIFNCLFGLDKPSAGRITIDGAGVSITKPAEADGARARTRHGGPKADRTQSVGLGAGKHLHGKPA